MLRIRRVVESGSVVLIVSGRLGTADLAELSRLIRREPAGNLVLDLAEVGLVDTAAVRFLVECEAQGIRLVQCPAYVREWMRRERDSLREG